MSDYRDLIARRRQIGSDSGFDPIEMPGCLMPFQRALVEWAIRKGRAAIFADCGLGKTLMQLVWADNVRRKTRKPVLILTPLAVSQQTAAEGVKFGIGAVVSRDGTVHDITVTNYQRLHYFDRGDFGGVVCDESSILKNCDGATRKSVTDFMRRCPYRLLCTATAAPNDWHELGTSSEALGYLGYRDMLTHFFKPENANVPLGWGRSKWRFKGHAEDHFWRWVCSWARACRTPADVGFDQEGFELPELVVRETRIDTDAKRPGMLFAIPATTLSEQREERRITLPERCERVADMVQSHDGPSVAWCHLNDEGDYLQRAIKWSVQVSGKDDDDSKESKLIDFSEGRIENLIIKPKIGAWGLNWQHCSYTTMFPSHSYEQYYQAVRRFYRFGQTRPVIVDIVSTHGEEAVSRNLAEKAKRADEMFTALVAEMNNSMAIERSDNFHQDEEVPTWLSPIKQ